MKNILNNKYSGIALTALFGIVAFLFWRVFYPHALVYQEQYQLFLFDSSYILERISLPGGVAAVIAECLTQFYNHPTIGAIIQSLLLVGIQLMTWLLMKRNGQQGIQYISSFIPALILWYVLGDESVLTIYSWSLLLTLTTMLFHPQSSKASMIYTLIFIPVIYWVVGPLVLLYTLFVTIQSVKKKDYLIGIGVLPYAVSFIVLSSQWFPYPVHRLFTGLFYYRFVDIYPYWLMAVPVLCLLVTSFRIHPVLSIAPMLLIPFGYDAKKYELMEYDYLIRRQQWDAIIAKAEKQQPDMPMSVCATNLALGMKNQLGNRAFRFYQHGTEGLLPKFERDFTSALLTGEVYYHLGLVNTAQRHAFEAMEAIPNYNKSGRIVKRLAETNLINGQYKVAEKYLRMLEKTVFYHTWAKDKLQLIAHEEQIDKHPLYGRMRQFRLQEDFLFSDTELDKIFGQLFMHNPKNQLAIQYLLIHPLLNKDIDSFMRYLIAVQEKVKYNPTVCQEGIIFAYTQRQQTVPEGFVNPTIQQSFKRFAQVYSQGGQNSPQLEAFKGTLWYYLMKE